jgi:hypothetical protein
MSERENSQVGLIVGIVGTFAALISLGIGYVTNRDKIDDYLCRADFIRLNCPARATLEFLYLEGWAAPAPEVYAATDFWGWGETTNSGDRRSAEQSGWMSPGRSATAPLECGRPGYEAMVGLDVRNAVTGQVLPFGQPPARSRPPYPSQGPLDLSPPGYDDTSYTRFEYWRLLLQYPESASDRSFTVREVVNPPVAAADENADHSVRTFFAHTGAQFTKCALYIPLTPREAGTYRVELSVTGDITGSAAGDVTFK